MKIQFYFCIFANFAVCEDCNYCDDGWALGRDKCYKFINAKSLLKDARKACGKFGLSSEVFTPSDWGDTDILMTLSKEGKLKWSNSPIWIDLKLKIPWAKVFPPKVTHMSGKPVLFTKNHEYAYQYWSARDRLNLSRGTNTKDKFLIQFVKHKWTLRSARAIKKMFKLRAKTICQKPFHVQIRTNKDLHCWQPTSGCGNAIMYDGTLSTTAQGFECDGWANDATSVHSFNITEIGHLSTTNNNYCRQTNDYTNPWCYTTDPTQKWDYCTIPHCIHSSNEIVNAQLNCGITVEDKAQLLSRRVIGGRDANKDEVPFIANLRYMRNTRWNHICGGTLISSCYVLTAAHCFQTRRNVKYGKYRVDVGSRFFHNTKNLNDYDKKNHQAMQIRKITFHPLYTRDNIDRNDLAMIELWPTTPNGTCVVITNSAKPACLPTPQVAAIKNDQKKCYVSGWGDTNPSNAVYAAPLGDALQIGEISIDGFKRCKQQYQKINTVNGRVSLNDHQHLCASNKAKNGTVTDACQGDSGGPLICRSTGNSTEELKYIQYITGVVSTGSKCGSNEYPGIYVPVEKYWFWIHLIAEKKDPIQFDESHVCKNPSC